MHVQSHHAVQQAPALPTERAFVVQFRAPADAVACPWVGRVEHLVSGHATHFTSWDHLQAFMAQLLADPGRKPPEDHHASVHTGQA